MKWKSIALSAAVALTVMTFALTADAGARQRLLPYNGLDRSFGAKGVASLPGSGGNRNSNTYACLPGANGSVFVSLTVGRHVRRGKRSSYEARGQRVTKLKASGRPARSFGRGGHISWSIDDDAGPEELHEDSRGGLLLLSRTHGTRRPKYTLSRRSASGRVDSAFGNRGKISLGTLRGYGDDLVSVLSSGRIAIASAVGRDTRVALFSADGKPAADFAAGQATTIAIEFAKVVGEVEGSIVVGGTRSTGSGVDYRAHAVAVGLGPDGKPSAAFGIGGELVIDSLPASIIQPEEQPTDSSKFVNHRLQAARVTADGKLDLLMSSARLEDDDPGYFWVYRTGPSGGGDPDYGISGAAYLSSEFGMFEPAQDEYEEVLATPMSDGSWLEIAHSYSDFADSYGLGRLSADGRSHISQPFNRVKFPKSAALSEIKPSADTKSIIICGNTDARTKSGGKRSFAWVARVAGAK